MTAPLDIAGERYGRLVALRRLPSRGRRSCWEFRCDCGVVAAFGLEPVRRGDTRSCGCLRAEVTAARSITHGHKRGRTATRELRAWQHAKGRCYAVTDPKYPQYGGRGITMCDEWRDDFAAFYRDMGPCPAGLTLDREDVNGPYAPWNCRWATAAEQARTRTDNVYVEHEGRRLVLKDFAAAMEVSYKALHHRVRRMKQDAHYAASELQRLRPGWSKAELLFAVARAKELLS